MGDVARLIRQGFACFRAQAASIIVVASVVVLGPALLVAFLEHWVEHSDTTDGNVAVAVAVAVAAAVLSTLGGTFLAGMLDRLVGHQLHGHPFQGLGHLLRTLPYTRLIVADLVVSIVVLAFTSLLVLPGLVAYTLLALVGPIIIIEEASVATALRRSIGLVRSAFWLVFFSVTSITVLEIAVEEALELTGVTHHLLGELAVTFVVGVLAGSVAAMIKVCAAYELIGREALAAADPGGQASSMVSRPTKG
jgi:hypothetical protein